MTTPEDEPTVAIPVLPLVHVPPEVAEASVNVEPAQIVPAPVIAAGGVLSTNCTGDVAADRPLLVQYTTHRYHNVEVTVGV